MSNWYTLRVTTSGGGLMGGKCLFSFWGLKCPTNFPFISTASGQALQCSSIHIIILHLYISAGHLPLAHQVQVAYKSRMFPSAGFPSFLPTHLSLIPACSLFLSFPLCSPSLTAGLVSRVRLWEWFPLSPAFAPIFVLTSSLFTCFFYLLPQWLKINRVDTTEKSGTTGNDRWPFAGLPTCLLHIWY